jgi:hypothetical protein
MRLRPRLTSTASQQLELLLDFLQGIDLEEGHDIRLLKSADRPYTTWATYALLDNSGDVNDRHGSLIWKTHVPNKVKIFAWLYFKDRLSTRVNVFSKHIMDVRTCERCGGEVEDRHHVFFGCTESKRLWDSIGLNSISWERDEDIWTPSLPAMFDLRVWPFVLLTILWRIWDPGMGISSTANNLAFLPSSLGCGMFLLLGNNVSPPPPPLYLVSCVGTRISVPLYMTLAFATGNRGRMFFFEI